MLHSRRLTLQQEVRLNLSLRALPQALASKFQREINAFTYLAEACNESRLSPVWSSEGYFPRENWLAEGMSDVRRAD